MGDDQLQSLLITQPGVLQLGPVRYLVMRPETISEIQKGVEDRLGIKSSEYLYTAGSIWAAMEIKRLKVAIGPGRPEELAQLFCRHATSLGWGEWSTQVFSNDEKGVQIRIDRSPFAEVYGLSDQPVCHLAAGAVAGLVESLFRIPATCNELSCRAQGEDSCRFTATGDDVAGADTWNW